MTLPIYKNKTLLLFSLCLAQFAISADIASFSIATSSLMSHFQADGNDLKIAGAINPLIGASFMLICSMVGLFIGWRRLLIFGFFTSTLSVVTILLAPSINFIIYLARPLSGLGSASILPAALALVIGHYPKEKRAVVFGAMAAATGIAAAISPLVSGWLFDSYGWRSGFFLQLSFFVVGLFCAIFWISPLHNVKPKKFDTLGSILCATSLVLIVCALLLTPNWGLITNSSNLDLPPFFGSISPALFMLIFGLIIFALFLLHEQKFERKYGVALLPVSWLRERELQKGLAILLVMYCIFGGFNFSIIAYLQIAADLSAIKTGAIILVFAIAMIISSALTPILLKEQQPKKLCALGFALFFFGGCFLGISTSEEGISALIYLAMAICGIGIGILSSQTPVIITLAVGEKGAAQSGGIQATTRKIGLALGIAVVAGSGQSTLENHVRERIIDNEHVSQPIQTLVSEAKAIPYINDFMVIDFLNELGVDESEINHILEINNDSRNLNFTTSNRAMLIFAVLGVLISLRLSRSKGKEPTEAQPAH
ncbi:MFS transporter [Vibrio sp. ZSDE26]|uniref:MFS transporter n=1 Tax=Vibrio amylolyticus TaxID=2847292 RepID=A0A9X1XKU1_9VIBR|nr:MFS transporter [Vibrio amylolyticus]MCK6265122.1 MFS transporter [Vibrio amylolyticus]